MKINSMVFSISAFMLVNLLLAGPSVMASTQEPIVQLIVCPSENSTHNSHLSSVQVTVYEDHVLLKEVSSESGKTRREISINNREYSWSWLGFGDVLKVINNEVWYGGVFEIDVSKQTMTDNFYYYEKLSTKNCARR